MNQPGDDELHAAFDQLRDDDRADAPPPEFRRVWNRAETRAATIRRARTWAPFWIVAAAGITIALGLALRGSHHDRGDAKSTAQPAASSLSTWTSPTAGLLNTSGRALLAPPPILSSILDGAASPPVQRKGD